MKIDDSFYYRKNALTNYMMSEALSKHRELLKKESKLKINEFIFPVLSAVVSVYLAKNLEGVLDNWLMVILLIPAYLILYYFISKLFALIYRRILIWIDTHYDRETKTDLEELSYKFNYNIVNQIYYSYSLINDINEEKDIYIRNYNIYESFINFENSIQSLRMVFNDSSVERFRKDRFLHIYMFRIELYFSMLRIVYDKLVELDTDGKIGKLKLSNLREDYNRLVDILNPPNNLDQKNAIRRIVQ